VVMDAPCLEGVMRSPELYFRVYRHPECECSPAQPVRTMVEQGLIPILPEAERTMLKLLAGRICLLHYIALLCKIM
jgi:hypothetical protein